MSLTIAEPYDAEQEVIDSTLAIFTRAEEVCLAAHFRRAFSAIVTAQAALKRPRLHSKTLLAHAQHVRDAIKDAVSFQKYLRVAEDRCEFLDVDALFGVEVHRSFPSARDDIREAGNCLGAECPTGTVFHLMRSAEVVLRLLAKDRQVEYADASIENKEWGNLLGALDGKLLGLRLAAASLWPSKDVKENQLTFYQTAIAEFRGFNDAWRKHVMHARDFYERGAALTILNHTKRFMDILSAKLSEDAITPLCWVVA